MTKYKQIVWLVLFSVCFFPAHSAGLDSCRGAILISKEIKPFIEMVEAVENSLDLPLCRVFFDRHGSPYSLDSRFKNLDFKNLDFIIAVGPAALKYISQKQITTQVFYGMVLNPDLIGSDNTGWCGVPLDLFTSSNISKIQQILPDIKRVALLLNPDQNQIAKKILKQFELIQDIKPVPVNVFSRSDIPSALQEVVRKADAIYFIPDKTVISPALVRHIIKFGISHKIPSIGYNNYFHQTGALLTFSINYKKTGRQVAAMAARFINSKNSECISLEPETDLLYNANVSDLLKIEFKEEMLKND